MATERDERDRKTTQAAEIAMKLFLDLVLCSEIIWKGICGGLRRFVKRFVHLKQP